MQENNQEKLQSKFHTDREREMPKYTNATFRANA